MVATDTSVQVLKILTLTSCSLVTPILVGGVPMVLSRLILNGLKKLPTILRMTVVSCSQQVLSPFVQVWSTTSLLVFLGQEPLLAALASTAQ